MALPAGFSLHTTAILRWAVRASHTSRNVRERVLPAPKTPATTRVDLPDRNASARLEARGDVPIVISRCRAEGFGKGGCLRTYVSVSPVASIRNRARKLCSTTIAHSRWYGMGTWPGMPRTVGLCSGDKVAI